MPTNAKSNIVNSLFTTFFNQVAVALLQIVQLQILARILLEQELAIFLVIKRFIAITFPIFTLNLGDSMARYISLSPNKALQYLRYTLKIISYFTILLLVIDIFTKAYSAKLLFGDVQYSPLMKSVYIFLFANAFQMLCVNYFRGKQHFTKMNKSYLIFWLLSVLMIPIFFLKVISYENNLIIYLITLSILSIIINLILLLRDNPFKIFSTLNIKMLKLNTGIEQTFVNYGVSRIPNNIFLGAIFFIPVVLATNYSTLAVAAYIGIVITVIRMLQIIGMPFNIIIVPKLAELKAATQEAQIKQHTKNILEFLLTLPLWIGNYLMLFSREIVLIWFGDKYEIVIPYLEWVSVISGLLIVFIIVRGVLDGVTDYPYINIITFTAFIALCLSVFYYGYNTIDLYTLSFAFGLGIFTLGATAVICYLWKFKISFFKMNYFILVGWFIISTYSVHLIIGYSTDFSFIFSILTKMGFAFCLGTTSLLLIYFLKLDWIKEFFNRLSLKQ